MSNQVLGIDLSHYQGSVNWPVLQAAGIKFAFIKAAQGLESDPSFSGHWNYLKANPSLVVRGAYHFYDSSKDSLQQANYFCNVVENLGPNDLPPVIDFEEDLSNGAVPMAQRASDLQLWIRTVKNKLGKNPIIYTNTGFFEEYLGPASSDFGGLHLWLSEYPFTHQISVTDPIPSTQHMILPKSWTAPTFWQYSENLFVPNGDNLTGIFDANVFNGSLSDLQSLCRNS